MRTRTVLVLVILVAGCGGASNTGSSNSGSRTLPASAARPQGASPPAAASPSTQYSGGSYGLLLAGGQLDLVSADGKVAAAVPVAQSSLVPQACGMGAGAWTLPAVSASNSYVYFRDGDTKIRMVVPPSTAVDVTTVPGGPTTVSGFSVSPDNQRIAVAVESFSGAGPSQAAVISLRLYVENLHGGGNHNDIYAITFAAGKPATMLWPMGWHQGRLILAVWAACTFESVPYPRAWHVVDSTTAIRQVSIGDANCIPSIWPSPAGVACLEVAAPGHVLLYDWSGKLVSSLTTDTGAATAVSPSGDLLAIGNGGGLGNTSPTTTMLKLDGSGVVTSPGHMGCLWIDENDVLASDAVIAYPSGVATAVALDGRCAGRFPGGL